MFTQAYLLEFCFITFGLLRRYEKSTSYKSKEQNAVNDIFLFKQLNYHLLNFPTNCKLNKTKVASDAAAASHFKACNV